MENDPAGSPRVYAKFDPMNVTSLSRFNTGPNAIIPPLSDAQTHALKVLEKTCHKLALHMILEPGEIQFFLILMFFMRERPIRITRPARSTRRASLG
jgi:hypothetical protein